MAGRSGLKGRRVLITAGPTREPLDPVRFLTNASSGRMGFAVAGEARRRGARVIVVAGPTEVFPPRGVRTVRVTTAEEMLRAAVDRAAWADVVVAAAAVGDWRFEAPARSKIKRTGRSLSVRLVPNPDVLLEVSRAGRRAGRRQVLVGFALETGRWLVNARRKLLKKGLDLIVANRPDNLASASGRGAVLDRWGGVLLMGRASKTRLAQRILDRVESCMRRAGEDR